MAMRHIPERVYRQYAGMAVAITGGAGFIGSHLTQALLSAGARVRVIDDLSTSEGDVITALIERYPGCVRFNYASILEPDALDDTLAGCRVVFHQAALASVPRSIAEPTRTHEVNDLGTLRVLESARRMGVRRIVNASSSSVYGDAPELPKHEGMRLDPLSPYAASKAAAEHTLRSWASSLDVDCVSLRYFNVFGPRQRPGGAYAAVIPAFINALSNNQSPTVYGDGRQSRDFTHVTNVVLANLLAGVTPKRLCGQGLNVGSGSRVTLLELLDALKALLDRPGVNPRFEPTREGDVAHSHASIDEARRTIGYEPVVDLRTGLDETVAWFNDPSRDGLGGGEGGGGGDPNDSDQPHRAQASGVDG
ncbi:MAG: NAD-dependent epimerase/dehydratase family protein [Phycisphaerales bacterium]